MSYLTGATNAQSLNGILTITDGVITISEGTISGLEEIDLNDLQVADTATIENLVVNNQIDMTSGQIKNVAAPTDNGDAVNKQYVDTNFLNKVTTTSQNVASRLTFNNTTSGSSYPIIELQNAITGSNNGMYLRFFKNFNRLPNTEIGSIVFADKNATSAALSRAVQLTASIDNASNPLLELNFNSGDFNPMTISNTQTILRCDDFYIRNKTGGQTLLYYTTANNFWAMSKSLNMAQNNITNVGNLQINNQIDMTSGNIINLLDPVSAQDASTKNYTDTASVNSNYLKRDGSLTMLGTLNMNSNLISNLTDPVSAQDASTKNYTDTNFINKTTTSTQDVKGKLVFDDISDDIITFENDLATASNGMRLLFKKNVITHPFLYVGGFTWADLNSNQTVRRMVELAVSNDGSTQPVFQMLMNTGSFNPLTINTTQTLLRNKEFYFINQQDQSNILSYLNSTNKIKMYKELDCANITSTGKLTTTGNVSCVDLSTSGNQVFGTNSSNTLDVKSTTSFEADVLIEGNKHLMLGDNPAGANGGMRLVYDASFQANGTAYFDARATSLIFRLNPTANPTSNKLVIGNNQTLVNSGFAVNGNTIIGNEPASDTCTFNCQASFPDTSKLTFENGSYIDGARINLIRKTSDFTLNYLINFENGVISDPNSSGLIITMPDTGGASGLYWNRRNYIIKLKDGGQTKLRQNTTTLSTKIDEKTGDIDYNTAWKTINLVFDAKFNENGQIWIISDR